MSDSRNKTDVFPTRIDAAGAVPRLPDPPNFQAILSRFKIFAFIIYMERDLIYYKNLEWNARYQKHFLDTGSYIRTLASYEEKPWSWSARKLMKDASDNLRKNVDVRTCFKFEVNNFLVKSCFTFGQRRVESGTAHVYQIGAVRVLLYFMQKRQMQRLTVKNKVFPVEEQYVYSKRNLRPRRRYVVPEGTVYLVYATNKCFFSVHLVRSEDVPNLPFDCIDPLRECPETTTKPATSLYKRPARTPLIEEIDDDDCDDYYDGDERDFKRPRVSSTTTTTVPPTIDLTAAAAGPSTQSFYDPRVHDDDDDPVLLELNSGARISENSLLLMPPPPPPPPPAAAAAPPAAAPVAAPSHQPVHQIITINTIPMDKTIKIVRPDVVKWYRDQFVDKQRGDPRQKIPALVSLGDDQNEPLDLSVKKKEKDSVVVVNVPPATTDDDDEITTQTLAPADEITTQTIAPAAAAAADDDDDGGDAQTPVNSRTFSPKEVDDSFGDPNEDSLNILAAVAAAADEQPIQITLENFMDFYADASFENSNDKENDPIAELFGSIEPDFDF